MPRVVIAVLTLCAFAAPAHAAAPAIVAGPGSHRATTFTTPLIVAARDDVPLLINADVPFHNLRALDAGNDDASWCGPADPTKPEGPTNPRRYAIGACPLFFAELTVPLGGSSPVHGLAATETGRTYAFSCEVFDGMRGLVAIVG